MAITVSGLYVYPLKSARGQFLEKAYVAARGLEGDRLWMVTDAKTGQFISQRPMHGHEPRMALIEAALTADGSLIVKAPGMTEYTASNPNLTDEYAMVDVSMHGKPLKALDAGNESAQWISDYLHRDARLMRMPDLWQRKVDPTYAGEQDHTGYSDGFPILVASEESHAALGVSSGMDRFRPNIVLRGARPFEEDAIASMEIRHVLLQLQKPCIRCAMPSVNQMTGEVDPQGNPIPALVSQRAGKGDGLRGTFFGVNASPRCLGTIRVGDSARNIVRQAPHPAVAASKLHYAA